MSRRNKLKVNRFKYNMKRYVFSGRYFVRNALFVMILVTIISIGVVGINLLVSSSDDETEAAEPVTGELTLKVEEPAMIDDISEEKLAAVIREEQKVDVSAKNVSVLTNTRYDMTGKFLCVTEVVNIRAAADIEGDVVGCLYKGATGEVVEAGEEWTKIKSGKVTGYVANDLILTDDAASEKAQEYQGYRAVVKEDKVCVRESSSEDADLLYLAAKDESFIVNKEESGANWYCVRLAEGTYGYVTKDLVTVSEGTIEAVGIDQIEAAKKAMKEIAEKEEAAEETDEETGEETEAADDSEGSASEAESDREEVKEEEKEEVQEEKKEEPKEEKQEEKKEDRAEEKKEEKETEPEETQEEPVEADASDLYLLAAITYCEAGAEPYEGQLAVANVVMNRLRSGGYGSTLADVIYAPYQFTGCKMSSFRTALKTGGSSSCLQAAQAALNGTNNIGSCKYFRPYKNLDLDKIGNYTIIGTHAFY